jgi:sulfur carrier protein ThiS
MNIRILRLGHSARHVEAAAGTTVGEILEQQDLPTSGYALSVNGLGASNSAALCEGDVICLIPKVEGGVL